MLAPICQICFEWWIWSICTPWKRSIIYQRQERGRKEEDCSLREGGGRPMEIQAILTEVDCDWTGLLFSLRFCAWTELDWKRDARTETKLKSGQALVDWTALYCSFAQCDCTAPKKPFIALTVTWLHTMILAYCRLNAEPPERIDRLGINLGWIDFLDFWLKFSLKISSQFFSHPAGNPSPKVSQVPRNLRAYFHENPIQISNMSMSDSMNTKRSI